MIENFKGKQNTNGFDKNPENIVPGRPRKLFTDINKELKEKYGVQPLAKDQLIEAYSLVLNTDKETLEDLINDKNSKIPIALQIIYNELKDDKNKADALKDYRDYAYGKAKQTVEEEKKIILESKDIEKKSLDEIQEIINNKLN